METLIAEVAAGMPERWRLEGDVVVDGHGNAVVERVRYLHAVPGYPDQAAYDARTQHALHAMAYGPDVMFYALRLLAALYAADVRQVVRLTDDLLDLLAAGLGVDRATLEEAVKPATQVIAERTLSAWGDAGPRN